MKSMPHVFEDSNLGKAPFKCVNYTYLDRQGTGCDHCGTGIKHVFVIESSDGIISNVGSSCVKKTGDEGLYNAANRLKNLKIREKKQAQRQKLIEANLTSQREKNGGLTDYEIIREQEEALTQVLINKFAPYAELIADNKGGFRDSIAETLQRGNLPQGRGLTITIDVLAKLKGRCGSVAYYNEVVKLREILVI